MHGSSILRTMLEHVRDDEALKREIARRMDCPPSYLDGSLRTGLVTMQTRRFDAMLEDPGLFVLQTSEEEFVEVVMEFHTYLFAQSLGALSGRWAPRSERRRVVDFIEHWSERSGIPRSHFLRWLSLNPSKYFGWRSQVETTCLAEAAE